MAEKPSFTNIFHNRLKKAIAAGPESRPKNSVTITEIYLIKVIIKRCFFQAIRRKYLSIMMLQHNYGLTPIAFNFRASACPPLADNFIYGLLPIALRQKSKPLWVNTHSILVSGFRLSAFGG
jgi:hypothetical protein